MNTFYSITDIAINSNSLIAI